VLLAFAGGFFAVAALLRRTTGRGRERVDLYFEDGSMVSLAEGSPEAATVLPLARRILDTARS
jgi:hypothetical protein